jgi:peptide chain release factor 2
VVGKRSELTEIEAHLVQPEIWGNPEQVATIQKRRSRLQQSIDTAEDLNTRLEEAQTFLELAREGEQVGPELSNAVSALEALSEKVELATLLSGEYDGCDAILDIHPGAGGTEAQDWAEMLVRMYTRWAETEGFRVELLDYQPGDEAGVKSVTLGIGGTNAYGYLKVERGVHRLVRISPFDSQSRRHTSFASIEVIPEVEGDVDVTIDEKDLRVDTYRASGAGGQHVNKTDSAIRITHGPSGIVVTCQNERSQHRNRELAMKVLRAKLHDLALREAEAVIAKEVGEKRKIEWGNQIRSYTLAPFRLVKDHRTAFEVGDADKVLNGDLNGFIRSALIKTKQDEQNAG